MSLSTAVRRWLTDEDALRLRVSELWNDTRGDRPAVSDLWIDRNRRLRRFITCF